jgi:outer membrane murein-binding lipoprotein Lpp
LNRLTGEIMRFKNQKAHMAFAAVALAVSLFASGCTSKITEEQLRELRDLRARESQLRQTISSSEAERLRVEGEVTRRQAEVRKCNEDKAFVQQQMGRWPNVWPDYTEPVVDTASTSTTKKGQKSSTSTTKKK